MSVAAASRRSRTTRRSRPALPSRTPSGPLLTWKSRTPPQAKTTTDVTAVQEAAPATHINGVPLYTRKGRARSRFRPEEKLALLACTEEELVAFYDEYATRRHGYIQTKATSDDPRNWSCPPGTPTDDEFLHLVARHLLGARVPGLKSQWIGTKAWKKSRQIVVDIDHNGDDADYHRRCRKVELALRRLGIEPEHCLITPTPRGGRHIRVFLTEPTWTHNIPKLLALVGLLHVKGRHEVFPNTTQGLRLPFGHIPGRPHDPDEWIRHVRDLQQGRIVRHHPAALWRRAREFADRQAGTAETAHPESTAANKPIASEPSKLRSDGKNRARLTAHVAAAILGEPIARREARERYELLLAKPTQSTSEIDELWRLGIRKAGTRNEVLGRLAWHLIHVKRLSEEEAVAALTDWAYQPGRHESTDIKADLANGTRKVEADIRQWVRWHTIKREVTPHAAAISGRRSSRKQGWAKLTDNEVEALGRRLNGTAGKERQLLAQFAVYLLSYVKQHGQPSPHGWTCCLSAHGVLQKFPGCSRERARQRLDWAIKRGFVLLTKEKRQSANGTGRAREYLVAIPPAEQGHANATPNEAVETICRMPDFAAREQAALAQLGTKRLVAGHGQRADSTHIDPLGNPGRKYAEGIEARCTHTTSDHNEANHDHDSVSPPDLARAKPGEPRPGGTAEKRNAGNGSNHRRSNDGGAGRTGDARHSHPQRAAGGLAKGAAERRTVEPPGKAVPHEAHQGECPVPAQHGRAKTGLRYAARRARSTDQDSHWHAARRPEQPNKSLSRFYSRGSSRSSLTATGPRLIANRARPTSGFT